MYLRIRTVHSGLPGSPYLSTMNFAGELDASVDLLLGVVAQFWTDLKPAMASALRWDISGTVQQIQETTGNIVAENTYTPLGSTGSAPAPFEWTAKQGFINWKTNEFVGGSRLHGRTYIPGVNSAAGEQVPTNGYLQVLQAAADELVTEAESVAGHVMVAVRRPTQGDGSSTFVPGAMGDVTGGLPGQKWAVLRSRRD